MCLFFEPITLLVSSILANQSVSSLFANEPIRDLSCVLQSGSTLGKPRVGFVAGQQAEQIPMLGRRNTHKRRPSVDQRNADKGTDTNVGQN